MTVLILDSNALRRGHFSVNEITAWMDHVGSGAEVHIPEVVIWEWAEHAAEAHTTLTTQRQEFRVDPAVYSRPSLPPPTPIDVLVSTIESLLPRGVNIWRAPDATYKQALQHQILQTGPTERKQGIKTGGADAIVAACVDDALEHRRGTEAVLLATNDHGLRVHCTDRFGDDLLLVSSRKELLQKLNAFTPPESDLLESLEDSLSRRIKDSRSDIGSAVQTFDMGYRIQASRNQTAALNDVPVRDLAQLGRVDIVEVDDLQIADPPLTQAVSDRRNSRVGIADVRIFSDVHMTQLELRPAPSGGSHWVTAYDGIVPNVMIELPITLTWDEHWELRAVEASGEAVLIFDSYDEGDEEETAEAD